MAESALQVQNMTQLHQVLETTTLLIGAMDSLACAACPALECFMVGLLWRLGYDQELKTFLRSRRHPGTTEAYRMNCDRLLLDVGTNVLVHYILFISRFLDYGMIETDRQIIAHKRKH